MDPLLWVVFLRAAERLSVVVVGALSIWIGYRLFVLLPRRREGEAKIELPGDVSIYVSRIAPGIFFALFGAGLIAHSATKPVSYSDAMHAFADNGEAAATAASDGGGRQFVGVGPGLAVATEAPLGPVIALDDLLRGLDAAATDARTVASGSRLLDIEMALSHAKLALLRERWDPAWGSYASLHRWVVEEGAFGSPPPEIAEVAATFRATAP